jgi:uncharacterized cupin superfamily protein
MNLEDSIYTKEYDSLGENSWEGGAFSKVLPRGEDIGATLYVLKPGKTTGNYHFHHGIEEILILIEGQPTLRTPHGNRVLKIGEILHFKKGTEGAHQVINHTDKEVRLVMISNQASPDVVEYPDQKLLSVMARTKSQNGQALWRLINLNE